MNKRQKLVQEQYLGNEEAVIRKLKNQYSHALKEINGKSKALQEQINSLQGTFDAVTDEATKQQLQSMIQSKVYQKKYQDALKKQIGSILDKMQAEEYKTVSEYLQNCYEDGFIGTMFDLHGQGVPLIMPMDQEAMVRAIQVDSKISKGLYTRLGEDVAVLKKKITAQVSRSISTGMSYAQTAEQLSRISNIGFNNAVRIARTEGHRIQVQSGMDACYKAKDKGADVVKQWDSTLDNRVRPSHARVDGEIRELDEPFSNGLMFPGDPSGGAGEVVNCRCALLQRARWALDEDELKTLKERAEYYGLDKSDNFKDFKKKYLKAASDDTQMTRSDMWQKIRDDQKRISDINTEVRILDKKIDKHNISDFDDLKGLKKSDISDRIKEIEERRNEIDPIISKIHDRPESGTAERKAWREWMKTIDRDSLINEQMELAVERADLDRLLHRWDDYEEWLQWKRDHPLDVLKSQKTAFLAEAENLEREIKDFRSRLAEIVVDHDCEIAQKFGVDHYDEMHKRVADSTDKKASAVWKTYESEIKVADPNYKGHEHCLGDSIYVNGARDAKGNSYQMPYQVTFHESGHAIDSLARKTVTDNSSFLARHYSSAYKNGLFPQTIKDEVADLVKAKDKELKAAFKAHAGDVEWFHDNGLIGDWYYDMYKKGTYTAEHVIPKYKKSYAYSAIQKEVKAAGSKTAIADLSDILEGATGAKIQCGFGHGTKYWKDRTYDGLADGLATEAFAEMIDSTFTSPESLEMIKKYLPKSYEVFQEMLENLLK